MLRVSMILSVIASVVWSAVSCVAQRARFYCHTAEPLGLTYTNLTTGEKIRLPVESVATFETGPYGYVAVGPIEENTLEIYRHFKGMGKLVYAIKWHDPWPLGWVGRDLMFCTKDKDKVYSLDSKTGKVRFWGSIPDIARIVDTSSGFLAVQLEEQEHGVSVTLFHNKSTRRAQWRTTGYVSGRNLDSVVYVENRYLILEIAASDKDKYLWIIDTLRNECRRLSLGGIAFTLGLCKGRHAGEFLLGLPMALGKDQKGKFDRVFSVSLKTLEKRVVIDIHKPRGFSIVGVSDDRAWMIIIAPIAEVGPGKLMAIRLTDGKQRRLQRNVYDCALVEE